MHILTSIKINLVDSQWTFFPAINTRCHIHKLQTTDDRQAEIILVSMFRQEDYRHDDLHLKLRFSYNNHRNGYNAPSPAVHLCSIKYLTIKAERT